MKNLKLVIILTCLSLTVPLAAQDTILFDNILYGGNAREIVFGPTTNLFFPSFYYQGLIEYNPENDSVVNWYKRSNSILLDNHIYDFAFDEDSALWLTSYRTGVYKFDEADFQQYDSENSPLPETGRFFIEFDEDNNLWVATADSGLYIRYTDGSWLYYPPDKEGVLRGEEIDYLYMDNYGIIYIGTEIGVTIHNNGSWTYINLVDEVGYYGWLTKIYRSSRNKLYVLTDNYCYIRSGVSYDVIFADDYPEIGNWFWSLAENNEQAVLITGRFGFLSVPKVGDIDVFVNDSVPGGDTIHYLGDVFFDKYRNKTFFNAWIHPRKHQMITFEDEEFKEIFCIGCDDLPSAYIEDLFFNDQEREVVASEYHFYIRENDDWEQMDGNYEYSDKFVQPRNGTLYFSGGYTYVYQFTDQSWQEHFIHYNKPINDITGGHDGVPYIGTHRGLYKKNKDPDPYWKHIGMWAEVNAVSCDIDGQIWVSMDKVIGKYDGEEVTYYNQFNSDLPPASAYDCIRADSLGRLWLKADTSIYIQNNEHWKLIVPKADGFHFEVYTDDFNNTWLRTRTKLYFMNEAGDTTVFTYENAPFISKYFTNSVMGPDNAVYIVNFNGVTRIEYAVLTGNTDDETLNLPEQEKWVAVFPNPADDLMYFSVSDKAVHDLSAGISLEIRNISGQKIVSYTFREHNFLLNTQSLAPGIYIYKLRCNGMQDNGKIIIR